MPLVLKFIVYIFFLVCSSLCFSVAQQRGCRATPNLLVLTAAHFAVAEFNKVNAGEMFAYKTVAITSAKIQVVAGIKYILDMLLGQTVCSRNHAAADSEPCAFQSRRLQAFFFSDYCSARLNCLPL
uniref:Cystatin domain-containing protein n=1 Tax=Astatotilapia calliptera TaxID=8154 RepID=A0AAX7UEU3_ASTCA